MILTEKAKKDFSKFYIDNNYDLTINFKNLPEIYQNALIIEWFDSVNLWGNNFYYEYRSTGFKDYKKSILSTIKKANEIYNMEIPKEEAKQKRDINTCRYFDIEVGCEREECICVNNPYEEPKQDIIMELEKDPLLKEFDNRVSKNLHILKNKKETLTNDTDSHSCGFENFEVIETEEDAKIFVETMENIPEPNDKLKKAFRDFSKQEKSKQDTLNHFLSTSNVIVKDSQKFDYKNTVLPKEFRQGTFEKNIIEEAKKIWDELHPNPIEMALFGAKWQQEQDNNKYSEEEVLEIIDSLFHQYASSFRIDAKEYFLLFKKK